MTNDELISYLRCPAELGDTILFPAEIANEIAGRCEQMRWYLRALLLLQDQCPECKALVRENQHFRSLKHNRGCAFIPLMGEMVAE